MTPYRKLGTVPRPKWPALAASCDTAAEKSQFVRSKLIMSSAYPKLSRTKRCAHQLAAGIDKNTSSAPSLDLNDYFEQFPEDVFVALEDFVELSASGSANDNLVTGNLLLILGLLQHIRFRCDRGYEDAIKIAEEFQHTVADLSAQGRIDAKALSMLISALHQAGISASPELAEAVANSAQNFASLQLAPNFAAVLDDLAKECRGDPFAVASMIAETTHAMPTDGCALIAVEQVRSSNPVIREAAALLLLDPEPESRGAVAAELQARVSSLSPVSLLRLITMRNWRAESERPAVDTIIRVARAKGVACAAQPEGSAEAILASCIDGSGAQGFNPVAGRPTQAAVVGSA